MTIDTLEIAKLRLKPGDVLAVRLEEHVTMCGATRLRDYVQGVVGENIKVLLLAPDVSLSVVRQEAA